jgi:hypothetical protein
MPTTPNRGWIYPTESQNPYFETIEDFFLAQDTDVHALSTNKVDKTIVDAKGDLIAATAADTVARLAVGTNNKVLVADSAQSTGLKWGDALLDGGANGMLVRTALATTVARTLTAGNGVFITNGTGVSANPIIEATTPELRSLIADSAPIVNTTTAAAFNKKVTLPAGAMNTAGALLLVFAFGTVSDTGTPVLSQNVRLGSLTLFQVATQLPTLVGLRTWGVIATAVTRSTGTSGVVKGGPGFYVVVEGPPVFQGNSDTSGGGTLNLTAALDVDCVAQWTVADPSNSINLTMLSALVFPIVGGTTS